MSALPFPLRTHIGCVALSALGATASAQSGSTVEGVVWDSVARAPLRSAAVQLADAADPAAAVAGRATTDSAGRFVVTGLRPGRYLVTFVHADLDVLGIEPPVRVVDLRGTTARVTLAIPSPTRLYEPLCGALPDSTLGALIGMLRDAGSGAPSGGTVVVRWSELVIGSGGMRNRERVVRAPADSVTGRFLLCRVPADAELAVRAERGLDTTGTVPVQANRRALVRRDLWLGGSARGTSRIYGRVVSETGQPIIGAQAIVIGTAARGTSDSSGTYQVVDAPAGTRTLELRAVGFAPERRVVDLFSTAALRADVRLTSVKRVLDTIRVAASRAYANHGEGFDRRRRSMPGHFIDADAVDRAKPARFTDLLSRVPSVRLEEGSLSTRIVMRGTQVACEPVVFLDGARIPGMDLRDLNGLLLPDDIGAVEVYTKEQSPVEFSTLDDCGVIVVWTKRRRP